MPNSVARFCARAGAAVPAAAAFAVALACAPARAQDEAAFDNGYAQARALLQKEKWKDAKAALDALLAANEKQLWAIAQKQTIVEDYRRCCFSLEVPVPKAQELISGELQSWAADTGRIKVRYTPKTMRDWQEEKGPRKVFVHPMAFKGEYSVTMRGALGARDNLQLLFDAVGDSVGVADFGGGDRREFASVRLLRRTGNQERELLDNRTLYGGVREGPYVAMLRVQPARLQVYVGDLRKPLVEAPRDKGPFGQVAVFEPPPAEIVLEGAIEPSWFQRVVDQDLAQKRIAFDKAFAPHKRLPAWLLERPPVTRTPPKDLGDYPAFDDAKASALRPAFTAMKKGDWLKARAAVEATAAADVPPVLREFLLGLALWRGGAPEEALPHVDQALAQQSDFTWTRVMRAQCLEQLRRHQDAEQEYRRALADDPGESKLYQLAVVEMLRHGEGDAARRLVKDAKIQHGLWDEMAPLDQLLAMLERGPQWPRRFHAQSPNYDVWSDIDERTCQQACSVLEESLVNLKSQFVWIKDDKSLGRFRVFLFAGEAGYSQYCMQILGTAPAHTAGLYSPILKQLLIWNLPKREEMEKTIRHEGFHQFLDRALVDPPTWFNEGMAEFWETARRDNDRFTGGQPRPDHVATLLQDRQQLPRLRDFVHGSAADYYAHADQRYPHGWALVHFLRKGPAQYQKLFPAVWEALRADSSMRAAMDKAFAGVDWDKFESDFWSYVGQMGQSKK